MMQRERRDILKNLLAKGFQEKQGSKHICLIYHTLEGASSTIITFLSRGSGYKSIGDPLLNKMAKQCKLPKRKFVDLGIAIWANPNTNGISKPMESFHKKR